MTTGFFWDEKCFWHGGGNYAGMLPVGGLVQPMVGGGLPESPESKRRLMNLMDVTGLSGDLDMRHAPAATDEDLLRVHPASYLDTFKATSDAGGGELGRRTPFGPGGYEMAALSAGLSIAALQAVLKGELTNAYAPVITACPIFPTGFACLPTSRWPFNRPAPRVWPNGLLCSIGMCTTAMAPRRSFTRIPTC
jgi:hypothetical protein